MESEKWRLQNNPFHFPFFILHVSLSFLLLSCAAPKSLQRQVPFESAADLLQIVSDDISRLQTFEGEARISVRIEGVRHKASAMVLFRRPDLLKFEVTGTLGMRLLTGVATSESLRIFLPRVGDLYEGPADGDILERITGVNLSAWPPWKAMLGVASCNSRPEREIEKQGDRLFVWTVGEKFKRRLTFDRKSLTLAAEEIYDDAGETIAKRTMSDYRSVKGVVLPRRIALIQGEDEIRLDYKTWKINEEMRDERLRLRLPREVNRVK